MIEFDAFGWFWCFFVCVSIFMYMYVMYDVMHVYYVCVMYVMHVNYVCVMYVAGIEAFIWINPKCKEVPQHVMLIIIHGMWIFIVVSISSIHCIRDLTKPRFVSSSITMIDDKVVSPMHPILSFSLTLLSKIFACCFQHWH